jgi:predicted AlkP superfamily phosphohydrolase/phosphomutase
MSREFPNRIRFARIFLIAIAGILGCGHSAETARTKKIIVLGIDGMDPGFLERHWAQLPNLNYLRKTGSFQRLSTTIPPQSPVAWSTFMTGLDPGGHGIFDFVMRDPKSLAPVSSMANVEPSRYVLPVGPYNLPLVSGHVQRFLRGVTFWQLLEKAHVPVTLLRMPNDFPPIDSQNRTLSGMGTPDMQGTYGTFTYYTDDPLAQPHEVIGGNIAPVVLDHDRVSLNIRGPENSLRKDRSQSKVEMVVHRDPANSAALFEIGDQKFLLHEGEWSDWIHIRFPILPFVKTSAGMVRVFAKNLSPEFNIYVSPVNIDPDAPDLPISTPSTYSRDLARAVGPFYTQGIPEDTGALRSGILTVQEYKRQSSFVGKQEFKMLNYELTRFKAGVLFLHYSAVDTDSHVMWGTHDDQLLETYEAVDAEVGYILRASPDSTLVVMSDHGFGPFNRAVNLNTWLYREGYLALDDPQNLGKGQWFAHVNWAKTKAYAMGINALYLNIAGREGRGIVPLADRDQLSTQISMGLLSLRDPRDGRAVVSRVYRSRDIYHGAAVEEAPDLILGWSKDYRSSWETALGGVPQETIQDNNDPWQGDHCIAAELVPGVLLSNRKSRLPDPGLADVTVTLLHEFGVRPEAEMRGRPIF